MAAPTQPPEMPEARAVPLRAVTGSAPVRPGTSPRPWDAIATPSLANFLLAVVVAVLFSGLASANVLRQTPIYQSTAVMLLDQPVQIAIGNEGTLVKLNLLRSKYTALLTTRDVMAPAAAKAGVTVEEITGSQAPTFTGGSLTIFPVVRSRDPVKAQRMAAATADALSEYVVKEQAATGLDPKLQITLRVIQPAGQAVKVSPQAKKARQVGIVAGVAGLVVAYVGLQLGSGRRRLKAGVRD